MENLHASNRNYYGESLIPWFITIACTITLLVIGYFLIENINWYKNSVFTIPEANEPAYRVYAYHIHLSMIKRSVGLFSGFAIMFLGFGVIFYTLKNNSNLEFKTATITASVLTASPGLLAMLLGGYLIISTIQSKDEFPTYDKKENLTKPVKPKLD